MINHWQNLWNDFCSSNIKYDSDITNFESCLGLPGPFFQRWGPNCVYGNWDLDVFDYIFITLNPGSGNPSTMSRFHKWGDSQTGFRSTGKPWPVKDHFNKNFFSNCIAAKKWHRHFTRIGKIITYGSFKKNPDIYKYLQDNVLFIDLLPYYSYSLNGKFNCSCNILNGYTTRLLNFIGSKTVNKNIYFLGLNIFNYLKFKGILKQLPLQKPNSIPSNWSRVEVVPNKSNSGNGFIIPFIPSARGISNTQWANYIKIMDNLR